MQHIIFLICLLATTPSLAQNLRPSEAAKHVGEKQTVCGKITGVTVHKGDPETTVLSLGQEKSKAVVSVAIWSTDYSKFKYVPSEYLPGKNICVTGWIKLVGGKPQIIISSQEQVQEN